MKTKKDSLPLLLGKAQKIFNAYIRNRDSEDGYFTCISCGNTLPVSRMNAGHYVPQKGGAFLRFNELNVHGECEYCNGFDQFHLVGYRKNLIDKIGLDAVEWLESNRHTVKKWNRHEVEEIITTYGHHKRKGL